MKKLGWTSKTIKHFHTKACGYAPITKNVAEWALFVRHCSGMTFLLGNRPKQNVCKPLSLMKHPQCFAHVINVQRLYINTFQLSYLIFQFQGLFLSIRVPWRFPVMLIFGSHHNYGDIFFWQKVVEHYKKYSALSKWPSHCSDQSLLWGKGDNDLS